MAGAQTLLGGHGPGPQDAAVGIVTCVLDLGSVIVSIAFILCGLALIALALLLAFTLMGIIAAVLGVGCAATGVLLKANRMTSVSRHHASRGH